MEPVTEFDQVEFRLEKYEEAPYNVVYLQARTSETLNKRDISLYDGEWVTLLGIRELPNRKLQFVRYTDISDFDLSDVFEIEELFKRGQTLNVPVVLTPSEVRRKIENLD